MARLFNDADSEYLESATCPVTTTPVTMACWFYTDDLTRRQHMFSIGDTGGSNHMLSIEMRGDLAGDFIRAYAFGTGGAKTAISSAGVSANTWFHACAVFTSNVDRDIFLDGGNKGSDNANTDVFGIDIVRVARATYALFDLYWSGRVAECGIWNVALTDEEVAALAGGVSPTRIRPESLVAYWPLYGTGSPEPDYRGTYNLTLFSGDGGPVQADHAPVQPPFGADIEWIETALPSVARVPRPPAAYNTLAIYG